MAVWMVRSFTVSAPGEHTDRKLKIAIDDLAGRPVRGLLVVEQARTGREAEHGKDTAVGEALA
jgi:hypothetical protein